MKQCQASFSHFDSNEELMPNNFDTFIDSKDRQKMVEELCSKYKVGVWFLIADLDLLLDHHSQAVLSVVAGEFTTQHAP